MLPLLLSGCSQRRPSLSNHSFVRQVMGQVMSLLLHTKGQVYGKQVPRRVTTSAGLWRHLRPAHPAPMWTRTLSLAPSRGRSPTQPGIESRGQAVFRGTSCIPRKHPFLLPLSRGMLGSSRERAPGLRLVEWTHKGASATSRPGPRVLTSNLVIQHLAQCLEHWVQQGHQPSKDQGH